MKFLPVPPVSFSLSDRNMLLSTTLCIFYFNTSDQVRFLLLYEDIFSFPAHFDVFFFISAVILIPHTFPTSSPPHFTFSSSLATFLFQSLMYLISLITHNCTNFFFPLAICQLETEPNTCYFVCPRPCIFKTH